MESVNGYRNRTGTEVLGVSMNQDYVGPLNSFDLILIFNKSKEKRFDNIE